MAEVMPRVAPQNLPPETPLPEPEAPTRFSKGILFWSIMLSVAGTAIVSFATRFDATDLRLFFARLHWGYVAVALVLLVLRVLLGGWRLKAVSSDRLTFRQGLRGQLAWEFFSNVTPSTVGGGPFAAAYVARDLRAPIGEGVAILLFAMLVEQAWTATTALVILAALPFVPVFPQHFGPFVVVGLGVYCAAMMLWAGLMAWMLLRRPDWIDTIVGWSVRVPGLRRFKARAEAEVTHLHARADRLRGRPFGFYLKAFLIAAAAWICRYAMLVFLVWAVTPEADGPLLFLRHMALSLGGMVLPTPGGAGGIEGLFALFIGPMIVPAALMAPVLLVWRALNFYVFLAVGVPLSLHSAKIARERQSPRP